MDLLRTIAKFVFTWWNDTTFGTWLWTRLYGEFVGEDEQGNRYYQSRDGRRRWVIYSGEAEASRVPPDWHGWLHHTWEEPPTVKPLPRKPWEKPHRPNMTGTPEAYHPPGSLVYATREHREPLDYEPWRPD